MIKPAVLRPASDMSAYAAVGRYGGIPPQPACFRRAKAETSRREIYRERVNKTLYISGDGALRYGEIISVIDASKGAGVNRVGIITAGMRRAVRQ